MHKDKFRPGDAGFVLLKALQPGFMERVESVPVRPGEPDAERRDYRIIGDVVTHILSGRHNKYSEKEVSYLLLLSWYCKYQDEVTVLAAAGAA